MKWKLFSIFIVLSLILVACNTTNEGMKGNDRDGNVQQTRYNDDVNNNRNNTRGTRNGASDERLGDRRNGNMDDDRGNGENRDNNDRYEISKEAANKITDEITEINHAYVLTTENNAYVAADLDANDNNRDGDDNATGDKNRTDRNDKADRNTDRNTDRNNNKADRNNDNRNNDGVNNRNVRNDDRTGDRGDQLTENVKDEIADIVKSVDNDIDNVYVSTDPDFMDLTSNYVNDMGNGHPVRGFFDKMGDMVQRLFPQNR